MLILTFEDSEEEILNHIVSYVSTGTKAFQVVENARTELRIRWIGNRCCKTFGKKAETGNRFDLY